MGESRFAYWLDCRRARRRGEIRTSARGVTRGRIYENPQPGPTGINILPKARLESIRAVKITADGKHIDLGELTSDG